MGCSCSRTSNTQTESTTQPSRVSGPSSGADQSSRTGTAPPRTSRPSPSAKSKPKSNFKTPGRTLGGAETPSTTEPSDASDARQKAAEAAQKRAEAAASVPKGKLGSKLAAQKAQTNSQALAEASRSEREARDTDAAAAARRWD